MTNKNSRADIFEATLFQLTFVFLALPRFLNVLFIYQVLSPEKNLDNK